MSAKSNGETTVVVGMSGGVDSSVSAYLLKQQGFNVVGLFMKNWEETNDCGCCTAEADFNDVKRVCEKIGIPYYSVNFSQQYLDRVFAHFLDGLKRGITPNPDVLCNREIKFGPFLDFADKIGADFIATGHYARNEVTKHMAEPSRSAAPRHIVDAYLLKGTDPTKDQSYFLCGLSQRQLGRVIFPVGDMHKTEVRRIARELGLSTAEKKDSTGICFIGERRFNEFVKTYLGEKSGEIRTLDGEVVGTHRGLMYYTIGQRKGMGLGANRGSGGGTPPDTRRWFVIKKDIATNTLYVNNGDCPELYSRTLIADNFNFICPPTTQKFSCTAKTRYRQPDQDCVVEILGELRLPNPLLGVRVTFAEPQRAVTPGQWVVLYDGDVCLGGGEITSAK